MDCFCKGTIVGLITGMVVGAIVVSKNKNLSNMIKEKSEICSKKISKVASKLKDSFSNNDNDSSETCHEVNHCECQDNFSSQPKYGQDGQQFGKANNCHC